MGLIKKVQHETKKAVSVQLEVGLVERLDRYAKYLGGTREYVISEAVKAALKEADTKDGFWIDFSGKPSTSKVRAAKTAASSSDKP